MGDALPNFLIPLRNAVGILRSSAVHRVSTALKSMSSTKFLGVIITYPYLIHPIPFDLAPRTPLVPRTPHTALPPLPARRTQLAVPPPQTCPRRGTPKKEKSNRLQKCSSRHAARSFAARHQ